MGRYRDGFAFYIFIFQAKKQSIRLIVYCYAIRRSSVIAQRFFKRIIRIIDIHNISFLILF